MNINTLIFTTPALFILLLGKYNFGVNRKLQFVVILVTFFLFIISGRRSVMLLMILLPFIPLVFSSIFPKKLKKQLLGAAFLFLCVGLITLYTVNKNNPKFIEDYTEVFLKAFNSDKEPIKFAQRKMLLEKFREKPILGQGMGAMFFEPSPGRMAYGYQFELSYHYKLASTGIIGFALIVGVYFWILFYGLYLSKRKNDLLLLAFLTGFFFMLIADATNPVLSSFDIIWPIYLCLARINYWKITNEININAWNKT